MIRISVAPIARAAWTIVLLPHKQDLTAHEAGEFRDVGDAR